MIDLISQRLVGSLLGRLFIGGLALLTSFRYGVGFYAWRKTELLERPVYKVVQRLTNGVEVRRYDPYLIAETEVDGTGFREPTAQGFRACAGYIFGKNKARKGKVAEKMAMTAPVRVESQLPIEGEKMAMTAPVRVAGRKKKNTKVSFVIGTKYSLQNVPRPTDKNIKLRQVPGHTLAVRKFAGPPPTDERVEQERRYLEESLSKANLMAKNADTLVYGYHDPFITPNFLRRNEVAVVIDGKV